MRSQLLEKKRRAPPTDSVPRDDVQGLVRRLVNQLASNAPAAGPRSCVGEEVLLDVQVDGVRGLLMRLPPQPSRLALVISPREGEIARMVARGYPNKTIAGVLEISTWTVGTYLRRIFAKLNVGSRAAMVARLMEEGLLKERQEPGRS
jgi:DNA-binding CsgD family transcriptional regulator